MEIVFAAADAHPVGLDINELRNHSLQSCHIVLLPNVIQDSPIKLFPYTAPCRHELVHYRNELGAM